VSKVILFREAVVKVQKMLDDATPAQRAVCENEARIESQDGHTLQDVKSRAHANGWLDVDAALWLYARLPGNGSAEDLDTGFPAGTSLAERMVVLKVMSELMLAERTVAS